MAGINFTGRLLLKENGKILTLCFNNEHHPLTDFCSTLTVSFSSYSLVFFTPEVMKKEERQGDSLNTLNDFHANRLAQEHSQTIPFLPPLHFRHDSTDALVINELLDPAKGSAYSLKEHVAHTMPSGFSLTSHSCILDVGAHIGVFSRLALAEGCRRIIAYEPEPTNFELLARNLDIVQPSTVTISSLPSIELHSAAVVHGPSGSRTLIQARNENSGKQNTWRHSLEEYSQYVDRTTLPSVLQKKTLERFPVECVSFFSSHDQDGALVPGITFVKLDCEGAEIDILLSYEASQRSSWLDCTHLVFEWSFTKERRVDIFHKAMDNLKEAGFEVYYEGIGSWWDTDVGTLWPYPNDAIIFAAMKQ
jgi:FkbM family methyltransferase